jgi:hypothetical protein
MVGIIAIGRYIMLINGKEMDIHEGLEATISYGSDSHPAKVSAIKETPAYLYLELTEYQAHADQAKKLGMGHQDWIIDWDKPLNGVVKAKISKKTGKYVGDKSFSNISLGYARYYYCWEF